LDEEIAVGWRVRVDGADDLVLERLGALVRGEHASGSPEEGVVRDDRVDGEAKPGQQTGGPLEPEVAVCDGTVGVTQVHELVLAERLHPGRIEARLMAEAMPEYLEAATAGRKPVQSTMDRADGMPRSTAPRRRV